ncbi:MAG: hypothetical protein EOM83_05315 [Clostridia bacterium]|nr:hypothetical protein [Clostridia bacterium]
MSKLREKINFVLLNPFVLAIPFALITIILHPFHFRQSSLITSSDHYTKELGGDRIYYYHDLDNDGTDDCIVHFQNEVEQCALTVFSGTGETLGQWNFDGSLNHGSRNLTYADFDGDGVLDVFTLYQREDSVFLGGINPQDDTHKIVNDRFLDVIRKANDRFHYNSRLYNCDLNNDGTSEIVAFINAGYSEQPRRIYAYNFADSTLLRTKPAGFAINDLSFTDLNNDGYKEIIPTTAAVENMDASDSIPYPDYQRWFVIYNHLLAFAVEPVNLGVGNGTVYNFPYRCDSADHIFLIDHNDERAQPNNFYSYDVSAKALNPLEANIPADAHFFGCTKPEQYLLGAYSGAEGVVNYYDPMQKMKIVKTYSIQKNLRYLRHLCITNSDLPDFIFYKKTPAGNQLYFYTHQFDQSHSFAIADPDILISNLTTCSCGDGRDRIIIQVGQSIYEFEQISDSWHVLKNTLINLSIYLLYVLMVALIIHGQKRLIKAHYRREKELAELKLRSIRNQMDPHFTFNAINAIAAAIYREDREEAYAYFSKFSKLIRNTMLYSDRMSRTLEEEIDFTNKYLEIEKFRYREKFEFTIKVHPDVNIAIEVPRMIIETFAESAINNGLMHRTSDGLLHIEIFQENETLKAIFEDNGVGMLRAANYNKDKAFKAARLMDEFLKIYNELNKTRIKYEMYDINVNEEFPGTCVVVKIPIASRYLTSTSYK